MRFRFCFCRGTRCSGVVFVFAEGIVKLVFPVFTILFYAQLRPEPPRKTAKRKENTMGKNKIPETGIYDARQLGTGRMLLLGFQHMFAMFGATILVPILTGLDVSNTLLFAGLGTLLFHLITGGKVPAFLGSSFAFLGGYATIAPMLDGNQPNLAMLPYACFGVACAGLVYVILAGLFKAFGAKKVMRFFPPIVTGPIIIAIGLNLSSSAINNCTGNWWIAIAAILIIVAANIWGKGMIKIIPILLGVIGSYVLAVIFDADVRANLVANVSSAKWFALPIKMEQTVFGLFASGNVDTHMLLTAVITIVPLSLATMVEHIGDVSAISSTCNRNYIENPGLHRTLMGDGLATTLAALFGAPPIRPTAKTPAFWPSAASMTRASSASRQFWPCSSPSARSSRPSSPPCPAAPSAASASCSTV